MQSVCIVAIGDSGRKSNVAWPDVASPQPWLERTGPVRVTWGMNLRLLSSGIAVAAMTCAGIVRADDWPQWRGPARTGISAEKGWSDSWPASGPKVAWKAKVGMGYSSLVVSGDRVVTLGYDADKDHVTCFDAGSGKELWRHSFPSELGDKYFDGGTTGTPTIAGGKVYVLNRWGDTFCLDLADGRQVWHRQVAKETGAQVPDWGFTGAPLVQDGKVFLNVGEGGLALDAATGAVAWKSSTKSAGYSTPLPYGSGSDAVLLIASATAYVAVRPADGSEAWRIKWLTQYGVNAADPIVDGSRVLLSTGYGKGSSLFKVGGAEPEVVWKSKALRTQMNAAVLWEGHLYGVDGDTTEKASLKCLDFATGAEKWTVPGFGSGGVMIADGKLIALSGTGELSVAPAKPDGFKPTSRAQVVGGKTWTAPVLSGGRIYCRNSRGDVVAVDVRK